MRSRLVKIVSVSPREARDTGDGVMLCRCAAQYDVHVWRSPGGGGLEVSRLDNDDTHVRAHGSLDQDQWPGVIYMGSWWGVLLQA